MHHYRQALLRMRQGDSDRDIAAARVMGRPKAAQWRHIAAAQGWLDAALPLPDDEAIAAVLQGPRRASSTVSTLEEHRERLAAWVEQGVSGTAIHAALRRQFGWAGSYSAVRRLLADIRSQMPPETTCRLDFEPGDAAQVDFGAGPTLVHPDGQPRRTWAFVMTLAHSRHQYVEFVWDQTVATWLGCHRRAFEWFAGVPQRVIIDNAKCAITRACAQDPTVQRAYAECAEGYRFKIDPCPPHDPQKKGIVESGVKYLKGNFLPLRTFRDLADLNAQARAWVLQEAGTRCHGTTRRTPLSLFELEAPLLQSLTTPAPDLGTWHRVSVHRDCHVQFERVLYSAPFTLVGKTLWLRATDAAVALFEDFRHVATHPRGLRPGQRVSVRAHLPPEAQAFFGRDRAWCATQAARVGPSCVALIEQLLSDQVLERLRAAQGVLSLLKPYGRDRLEAACARALAHGSAHYRTVKTILATSARPMCRPAPHHAARLRQHPLHAPSHRAVRRPHSQPAARAAALTSKENPVSLNPAPELAPQLKQLRLSGIFDSLEARNRQAIDAKMAYTDFLALLISDEVARREQKKFSTRLRRAQFRTTKTLEQFDFERLPQLNRALVHDLATGRYLQEKAPVLIVGPCGTGKSHLAQALGHCAVRQGVDVVFATCASLTQSLNAARATGSYERKLATLARVPLLIIDDFGLKPLRAPADEDLHDLIAERYEQAATIVTSNLDFTEWDQAFPANRLLASASLDRLRHNAYCLVLDGQSYRSPKQLAGSTKSMPQKTAKSPSA